MGELSLGSVCLLFASAPTWPSPQPLPEIITLFIQPQDQHPAPSTVRDTCLADTDGVWTRVFQGRGASLYLLLNETLGFLL